MNEFTICEVCSHEHFTPMQCAFAGCRCDSKVKTVKELPDPSDFVFKFKLLVSDGIDPFAPKNPYPYKEDGETCSWCNKKHPCKTRYVCKKDGVLCASQTLYRYKQDAPEVEYINEIVDYSICSFCGGKISEYTGP